MQVMKFALFSVIALWASCSSRSQNHSDLFSKGIKRGKVSHRLEEASGLAASMANPGYLWTLNDSGNPAEVFLINDKAEVVLVCELNDVANRDWEDIAVGPGPIQGAHYLYVGEIGDNNAKYEYKYLYRFREPVLDKKKEIVINDFDTLVIELPDGKRDMESIALDHETGNFYFISKREEQVNIYKALFPLMSADTIVPEIIGTLPYHNVVAADFSIDGSELLVKTYEEVLYWRAGNGQQIDQVLLSPPIRLTYRQEPQGEAIAWALDKSGFYTLGESTQHEKAHLYFYKRN